MKLNLLVASSLLFASAQVLGDDTVAAQLKEQEQRIKVLERKLELQEEAKTAAASNAVVRVSPAGFSIQSGDGRNVITLHGNFAFDGRWFSDQSTPIAADTWLVRRARPYFEGTINDIYDFRLMPDFAGGKAIIQDAYVAARLKSWAAIQAGKFKAPVGLERLQREQYSRFMELGLTSDLLPYRDLGLQFSGAVLNGTVNYAIGYFNGTIDGVSSDSNTPTADGDNDGKKEIAARVFLQPFLNSENFYLRGLGFGVGGTTVNSTGSGTNALLPSYKTPGQQTFFSYRANTATGGAPNNATYTDGERRRFAPQAYYYVGPLGVIAEYVHEAQGVSRQISAAVKNSASLDQRAWQVSAAYFLTGEEETYTGFTPNNNFTIGKPGWGAWEIVARIHELKLDDAAFAGGANSFADPATQANRARATGGGVNWYLNQNVKWQLNFERTKFTGGAAGGNDRPQEKAILTRFVLVF
ncbi:MAG TPA: porin [Steroidobacteraceae bacterium]|nr:porin [Steroidobacteraceae bacterium]